MIEQNKKPDDFNNWSDIRINEILMITFVTKIHISYSKKKIKTITINASNKIFLIFFSTISGNDIIMNPKIKVYRQIFITSVKNWTLKVNFKKMLTNKIINEAIAIKLPQVAIFVT